MAAGTSSTALKVGLDTSTAGVFTGQANLDLASHDSDLADIALATGPVDLEAQVNNYAHGSLDKTGGAGSLFGSGMAWTLDFGTVTQSAGDLLADLGMVNDAVGPADDLSAVLDPSNPALPSFLALDGFDALSDIAAGDADLLSVALDPSALGFFDVFVTLDLSGSNASGYDQDLADEPFLTLELTGNIVAAAPPPTPEPGTLSLFGTVASGLAFVRRRRQKKSRA